MAVPMLDPSGRQGAFAQRDGQANARVGTPPGVGASLPAQVDASALVGPQATGPMARVQGAPGSRSLQGPLPGTAEKTLPPGIMPYTPSPSGVASVGTMPIAMAGGPQAAPQAPASGPMTSAQMQTFAQQLAQRAMNNASPNVAGQKASTQQMFAQGAKDSQNKLAASAAARGVMQSGNLDAQQRRLNDATTAGLTNAYNQIDQNAQEKEFQNQMAASGLFSNLAQQLIGQDQFSQNFNLQQELGRGNLDLGRGNLSLQSELGRGGLDLQNKQFLEQIRQWNLNRDDSQAAQSAASSAAASNQEWQRQQAAKQYDLDFLKLLLGSM